MVVVRKARQGDGGEAGMARWWWSGVSEGARKGDVFQGEVKGTTRFTGW